MLVNPAESIRKLVQELCRAYVGPPNDSELFREFLERIYKDQKRHLASLLENHQASEFDVNSALLSLSVPAVGLLTYGNIDVIEDVLRGIPMPHKEAPEALVYRLGSMALKSMFPMPNNFDPRLHREEVKTWFRQNAQNLLWDAVEGVYKLPP